jgi:hypothetical protein
MSLAEQMSPVEESLRREIEGLRLRVDAAIEGWALASQQVEQALANTDRAIAQTQEAIALAQHFREELKAQRG